MPIEGKLGSLYVDKEQTQPLFPRTKTKAITDDDNIRLDITLDSLKTTVNSKASEAFVMDAIANAQLGGGEGDIDLSGYATKDDISILATKEELNTIDYPVDSVNGKMGAVTLNASDVGAQPEITGLTNSMVMICNDNGEITSSTISTTELANLDGVTSNIQTQLDNKAASTHRHTATDIISSILIVDRGGTGRGLHNNNAILTGNGTSPVKNVATASGAFYATTTNGAAKFGTLPIAQGGTGATDAATACAMLGLSPSMNPGTEYATREKYKNKQVYAKVVSLDLSTGAGNKYVTVNSSMKACLSFNVYILKGVGVANHIAFYPGITDCFVNVDSGNFFVNSEALSGCTAYALVKYIK